jgi:YgiT-type zinc finger domain-containing protein
MGRRYHRCHFCGGDVREERVTVDYRWGQDTLLVIRNVPAGVCQACGEQFLRPDIVKELEKAAQSSEEPESILRVPLRKLRVAQFRI